MNNVCNTIYGAEYASVPNNTQMAGYGMNCVSCAEFNIFRLQLKYRIFIWHKLGHFELSNP